MKRFLLVAAFILTVFLLADIFILHQNDSARPTGNTPETQGEMERENEPDGMEAANVAPGFNLPALDGGEVSLEDYKGRKILLNFWASWCPPCRAEMPDLDKVYQNYKDKGVVVLAINLANTEYSPGDGPAYIQENGFTFPVLIDKKGSVGALYQVISLPTTYFIDSDGIIRGKVTGPLKLKQMEERINELP